MRVRVIDREEQHKRWGSGPGSISRFISEVEIADHCLICGAPRGVPHRNTYVEDGERYEVDNWENACAHLDLYRDVLREAHGIRRVVWFCRWYNARGEVFQTTRHSEKSDALAEAACCYRGGNRATIQRAVMDGPDYPHVGPEEDAP